MFATLIRRELQYIFESSKENCCQGCVSPPQDKFDLNYMLAISKIYEDILKHIKRFEPVKKSCEASVQTDISSLKT